MWLAAVESAHKVVEAINSAESVQALDTANGLPETFFATAFSILQHRMALTFAVMAASLPDGQRSNAESCTGLLKAFASRNEVGKLAAHLEELAPPAAFAAIVGVLKSAVEFVTKAFNEDQPLHAAMLATRKGLIQEVNTKKVSLDKISGGGRVANQSWKKDLPKPEDSGELTFESPEMSKALGILAETYEESIVKRMNLLAGVATEGVRRSSRVDSQPRDCLYQVCDGALSTL